MVSCRETYKLATDINYTIVSSRPSRNSQGIHGPTFPPTPMPTTPVPEAPVNTTAVPHTAVTTHWLKVHPPQGTTLQSKIPQALTHQYPCQLPHRTDNMK